jgi:membrane-associated phospholipid phosphatase
VRERLALLPSGTRAVLAFLAVALFAVPFSILLLLVATKFGPLWHLDRDTADSLHTFALAHPAFTSTMKLISRVGSPVSWWVVLTPLFVWLLIRRMARLAAFVAATALGSSLLNNLIKAAVDRSRPHLPDPVASAHGTSFPSGHAQAATVGCSILLLIFLPRVGRLTQVWLCTTAAFVVAAIGFSRIALGVHYLSDVLAGIIVGVAWFLAMTAAFTAWPREEHWRPGEHSLPEHSLPEHSLPEHSLPEHSLPEHSRREEHSLPEEHSRPEQRTQPPEERTQPPH